MGKAKNNEAQVSELTEQEFNHIKILQTSLAFHTLKDQIMSGFLYSIANGRLGFKSGVDLQFEIDLESDSRELKVTELPPRA